MKGLIQAALIEDRLDWIKEYQQVESVRTVMSQIVIGDLYLNMYQPRNQLRKQEHTPTKVHWERGAQFQQAQRQKYQKSELSYHQSQVSLTAYDERSVRQSVRQTSDARQLYERVIPVRVKSSEKEDYSTALKIVLLSQTDKGAVSVVMHITDQRNLKFLWIFAVKQTEYLHLKSDQSLKGDFNSFPEMITDLLDLCVNEKEARQLDQTFFHCQLEIQKTGFGSVKIIEVNKYKESVHLTLLVKVGSDEQVKDYLSDKLSQAQLQVDDLSAEVSHLQQAMSARCEEAEKLSIKYKDEISEKQQRLSDYDLRHKRQINELKQSHFNELQRLKKDHETEREKAANTLQGKTDTLSSKLDEVKRLNENHTARIYELESKERQLSSKLTIAERETGSYQNQLDEVKKDNKDLDMKIIERQRIITTLKCNVEALTRQLQDKKSIIESNSELKSNTNSQITSLEEKAREYRRTVDKQEKKISQLEAELSKATNFINDLKDKYEKRKEKLQERNQIIKKQQAKIERLDAQILEMRKAEANLKRNASNLEVALEDKDARIKDLKLKLEQAQQKLTDEASLITHLQKQLNERAVGAKQMYLGGSYVPNSSSYVPGASSYASTSTGLSDVRGKLSSEISDRPDRTQPVIKRYQGMGVDEGRDRSRSPLATSTARTNVDLTRNLSKSPQFQAESMSKMEPRGAEIGRLNQERDPDEAEQVKPVRFKYSKKSESEV